MLRFGKRKVILEQNENVFDLHNFPSNSVSNFDLLGEMSARKVKLVLLSHLLSSR